MRISVTLDGMDDIDATRAGRFSDIDSVAVHAGREDLDALGVHALPIDLSTTNPLPDIDRGGDSYESMATGHRPLDDGGFVYARLWNPTVARFEDALAQMEETEAAVAFSSGMAAMTAAILANTTDGAGATAVASTHRGRSSALWRNRSSARIGTARHRDHLLRC